MSWEDKYKVCRHCALPLEAPSQEWALRRFEQGAHSECEKRYQLRIHACCEKATRRFCVCDYSIECPDHGHRCWGSHD